MTPEYAAAAKTLREAASAIRWIIEHENRQMTSFLHNVLDFLETEAKDADGRDDA